MRNGLLLSVLLALIASPAAPLTIGKPGPRIAVHRPSATEVVVYDARAEVGINAHELGSKARESISKLGMRLVRTTLYWNVLETTEKPGLYDSAYLATWDKLVDDCRKEGIVPVVVVHGDPPGVSYADRQAAYHRYGRFMSDMAKRYPSVIYWELFNEMDSGFTCLFGAKDEVPMRERGRNYAEMLKTVYPMIKAVNPAAEILTGGMSNTDEFPRGIYENGGGQFFDILNIHTYGVPVVTAFVERGQRVRALMQEFGDANKPLWNTEFGLDAGNVVAAWGYPHSWDPPQEDSDAFDARQLEDYRSCFEKNAELSLYTRLLPYAFAAGNERDDAGDIANAARLPQDRTIDDYGFGIVRRDLSPRPVYTWLEESQFNESLFAKRAALVNVVVKTEAPMVPIGYEFRKVDGGIEIQRVLVDPLTPTRIRLMYVAEPETARPGATPAQPAPKKGTRPHPDPFDI